MDVSSFSKERILITLNQSYNFDNDIVAAAKQVALEKGYMSSFEIDRLLEKNEEIREEKRQANYEMDKKAAMGDLESDTNAFSKWFFLLIPTFIIIVSIAVFLQTGWLIVLGIGPTAAAGSIFRSKRRFR